MTTLREAAQQALEALDAYSWEQVDAARAALRTALAEPEQEPVAWGMPSSDGAIYDVITPEEHARAEGGYTVPLYTHPSQRKPLSDEKVWDIYYEMIQDDRLSFARAIERAHGIGGEA